MLSCDRTRCPVDVVMSQDTHPCFIMRKICCPMEWMLSCDRTRFPVDVVLSQDTPPLFNFCWKRDSLLKNICCRCVGRLRHIFHPHLGDRQFSTSRGTAYKPSWTQASTICLMWDWTAFHHWFVTLALKKCLPFSKRASALALVIG